MNFVLGVVKHVGDALCAKSPKAKSDIVCIGFSPWGVIEGRENLIGVNVSERERERKDLGQWCSMITF